MKIKVASYNICSGRTYEAVPRRSYDFSLKVIREMAPDIIGLNEIGTHDVAGFPAVELGCTPMEYLGKKLGMNYYFARAITVRGHDYGNGILTKYPLVSAKTVLVPDVQDRIPGYEDYYETRSILVAEVDVCGTIVTVLVSHFGLMDEEKINAVNTAIELVRAANTPVLLMGDFNMRADDEKLAPLFQTLHDTADGKKEPMTWPSNLNRDVLSYEAKIKNIKGKESGRKIDYIFTSGHFKTERIEVVQSMASDHLPLITYLDLQEDA